MKKVMIASIAMLFLCLTASSHAAPPQTFKIVKPPVFQLSPFSATAADYKITMNKSTIHLHGIFSTPVEWPMCPGVQTQEKTPCISWLIPTLTWATPIGPKSGSPSGACKPTDMTFKEFDCDFSLAEIGFELKTLQKCADLFTQLLSTYNLEVAFKSATGNFQSTTLKAANFKKAYTGDSANDMCGSLPVIPSLSK